MVPGPGDLDSTGSVELRLIPDKKKICFIISHENLAPDNPILGHVHKGKLGELGSDVVTLFEGIPGQKSSSISECAKATPGTLKALAHNPEAFYVDLRTPLFPNGALRGQLFKKP